MGQISLRDWRNQTIARAAVRWCGGAAVRRCGGAGVRECGGAVVRIPHPRMTAPPHDRTPRLRDPGPGAILTRPVAVEAPSFVNSVESPVSVSRSTIARVGR